MRRLLVLLTIGAATVAVASAAAAPPSVQVLIRHQLRGCHAWAVNNGAFNPTQHVTVTRGTTFTFTDNDVMPHTLVQLAGPKVTIHGAFMHMMGARATTRFLEQGTYVFRTKAGEDYPNMHMGDTIGADNVLKLTVIVK